jgi:tryptophan synthase
LQGSLTLVTFVTAGYPTIDDTVPILLGMQAGGVDIIELGVPFSDPVGDGPVIQETNTVRFTIEFPFAHHRCPLGGLEK